MHEKWRSESSSGRMEMPYLEHFPEPGGSLQRVYLGHFPFRLGRDANADLVIYSPRVSKSHAMIVREADDIKVTDLGSTNGTFVNGKRVEGSAALLDGDIIHLAHKEFRFGFPASAESICKISLATESAFLSMPRSLIQDVRALNELIEQGQVSAIFQPVVSLADRTVVGYEALGRGGHDQLPQSPGPLFSLAGQCQLAVELSRVFRRAALRDAVPLPTPHLLFLNVHPDELHADHLLESLEELARMRADWRLVVEVHEDFVADMPTFQRLHRHLREMDIRLAYDDFGVGQARLAALAQVPADYVKLDMTIVQGLPHSRAMRDLVRGLATVCSGLGTQLIAEGMETEDEATVSRELGCQLGQGYLFARPQAAEALAKRIVSGE